MSDPTVTQDVVDLLHAAVPVAESAVVGAAEVAAPVVEVLAPQAAPIIAVAIPAATAILNHTTEIESWLALLVPGQVTQGIQGVLEALRKVADSLQGQ